MWDGQLDEALRYADASASATQALGPRAARQLVPHMGRAICLAELDRDAEAMRAFEDALRLAEHGIGTDYLGWCHYDAARLRFYQGRWDEALAQAQAGLDLPDVLAMGRHLHGVIALIAVHRHDRAALAEQLPFLHAPRPAGPADSPPDEDGWNTVSSHMPDWALAQAAHAEGRAAEAAAILGVAWDVDGDEDRPRFPAHYLVPDLVGFNLAAGDPAAARRVADSIGWDALTDAETVIAGLVAEGLSNPAIAARLYLSRRTVQFHVSSILAKLGAASRVEFAAMFVRHAARG